MNVIFMCFIFVYIAYNPCIVGCHAVYINQDFKEVFIYVYIQGTKSGQTPFPYSKGSIFQMNIFFSNGFIFR